MRSAPAEFLRLDREHLRDTPCVAFRAGERRAQERAGAFDRRFDADDNVIEYAELIARADTRVAYRYEYRPADAR